MLTEKERKLLEAALAQLPSEMRAVVEKTLREYEELFTELTAITLPGEKWRWIKNYEGLYMVSTKGRVVSFKHGRITLLKPHLNNGYLQVTLSKNSKAKIGLIHRLVAEAFIPNPENKPEVDHANTNKTDNNVTNLRWATGKENYQYAAEAGLIKIGENNSSAKFTEEQVRYIRKVYIPYHPEFGAKALAKKFGVHRETIYSVISGKSWKHVK